jgi:CRISPR/Cas system CMR-associated protein Cmr1 (group 7 of RAMP superfamily)
MQKKFKKNKIKAPKNKTKQTYKKEDKTKREKFITTNEHTFQTVIFKMTSFLLD